MESVDKIKIENYLKHLDVEALQFIAKQLICFPQSREHIISMVDEWDRMYGRIAE